MQVTSIHAWTNLKEMVPFGILSKADPFLRQAGQKGRSACRTGGPSALTSDMKKSYESRFFLVKKPPETRKNTVETVRASSPRVRSSDGRGAVTEKQGKL